VNLINGVLGDKSFFDSADRGMQRVMADYPQVQVKTIEAGIDPARWQAAWKMLQPMKNMMS
jgi:basic membrane protein A and related proteins